MATEIKMPKLGIDMVEGSISQWLKAEGDAVQAEEPIAEVETDKSTVEMNAPAAGTLLRIVVQAGELVPVGAVIAYIGEAGESVPDSDSAPSEAKAAPADAKAASADSAAEAAMPTEGEAEQAAEESEEGPGESGQQEAAQPPPPAESEEDDPHGGEAGEGDGPRAGGDPHVRRTAPSKPAPSDADRRASPVARRLAEEEGIDLSKVKGTGPGGRISKEDVEAVLAQMTDAEPALPGGVRASPAARRLAREAGVDLATLTGTGPQGRIVARDVTAAQPAEAAPVAEAKPAEAQAAPAAAPTAGSEVPLSRMRKRITEVLTASKAPVPHFYVTMDIDMGAAMGLRQQINGTLADEGIKVSVNDLVVKATALALRRFPNINSSFGGDKVVLHGDINVGIAVSTPAGLMTVATRGTDRLSLSDISQQVKERAGRAREGKIKQDDIGGTTFTVSNLGMYGVDSFVAIITPPEAGIIAVGGIRETPVVREGQIVIGQMMRATLSADHRVTDGAEGAEFMVELKRLLENPMRLML